MSMSAQAQIGEHRNDLAIGVNAGYGLNTIGFVPKVTQKMYGGLTGGFSVRYVCEKYVNTICSVSAEVNYAALGWKDSVRAQELTPEQFIALHKELYER